MSHNLPQWLIELPWTWELLLRMTAVLTLAWVIHFALIRNNPRWQVPLWRFTAVGLVMIPLLAIVSIFLGILGGGLISNYQLNITPNFYLTTVTTTVTVEDLLSGLSKTFFFGWIIAMVGCHAGLTTQGGTEGVGKATTRSVVVASISIFIADFFLTKVFLML
jgi:phospholipid/cholesterol/gamma-HCH transport system permease protein